METAEVTCPTCFESFDVPVPETSEVPCELDYDCEICCRPMTVLCGLDEFDQIVTVNAVWFGRLVNVKRQAGSPDYSFILPCFRPDSYISSIMLFTGTPPIR